MELRPGPATKSLEFDEARHFRRLFVRGSQFWRSRDFGQGLPTRLETASVGLCLGKGAERTGSYRDLSFVGLLHAEVPNDPVPDLTPILGVPRTISVGLQGFRRPSVDKLRRWTIMKHGSCWLAIQAYIFLRIGRSINLSICLSRSIDRLIDLSIFLSIRTQMYTGKRREWPFNLAADFFFAIKEGSPAKDRSFSRGSRSTANLLDGTSIARDLRVGWGGGGELNGVY